MDSILNDNNDYSSWKYNKSKRGGVIMTEKEILHYLKMYRIGGIMSDFLM